MIQLHNADCFDVMLVIPDKSVDMLDNCMGSGTCGVACVNLGRRFNEIEMEMLEGMMRSADAALF